MKRSLQFFLEALIVSGLFMFSSSAAGQDTRTFDGYNNNPYNPEWGTVGTNQLQVASNGYADGVSEPAGIDRPNPRYISNQIFHQDGIILDIYDLSDYAWLWGQFIDHDVTLVVDDPNESLDILVPSGDIYFDPYSTGTVYIEMFRSAWDPSTGTDSSNPRAFPNGISSFIDGSNVYGSSEERANWLRTFANGKLKTSTGNLLPYNTTTGELGAPIDPNAPEMAMANPFIEKWFIAGDVRANENALLTSMHTIFMREHNRQCELIAEQYPAWDDEQIYQYARKRVGGIIEAIVYEEWLPTMAVHLTPYAGYNSNTNPGIMNVFSAAAYRYGHSVINSNMMRLGSDGEVIPQGNIALRDAFFTPSVIVDVGGVEPYLRGAATQVEQDFDTKIVSDLRNFLFGPPGAGGLDLAAVNINRGRERGLPDYNTARADFGLATLNDFSEITSNPYANQLLENVFGDINDIDPWVGFLAEEHMSNTLFGETVMKIMEVQFTALRDGDRFYYENDLALTQDEIAEIKATRLVDVIKRNTDIDLMQNNVFLVSEPVSVADVEVLPLDVQTFPNPTTFDGRFILRSTVDVSGDAFVQVANMLGQVVIQEKLYFNAGQNDFEMQLENDLPSGLYNVNLVMENRIGQANIFKQ
jgi:Animal haem peroxidase